MESSITPFLRLSPSSLELQAGAIQPLRVPDAL
jgi:hypothetical protein